MYLRCVCLLPLMLIAITAIQSDNVRLSGGFGRNEGAIQVEVNGRWRYLCDTSTRPYYFKSLEGNLACQNVGYKESGYYSEPDTVDINWKLGYWKSNITCDQNDVKLMNCRNTGWEYSSACDTSTSTIVYCTGEVRFHYLPPIDDVGAALIYDDQEGRYQKDFTEPAGRVFCKQMGYSTGVIDHGPSYDYFPIVKNATMRRESYMCNGNESRLSECRTATTSINCTNDSLEAAVKCTGALFRAGKVVSLNEYTGYGVVQVYDDLGETKAVCADWFDSNAARVACRGMGYGVGGRLLPATAFNYLKRPLNNETLKKYFNCQGTEFRLRHCDSETKTFCPSEDVVAVAFSGTATPTVAGTTRIGDDNRVEVYYHGYWGTVCPRHWDDNAAKVVCKGLAQHAKAGVIKMEEDLPRWVFDVNCTGDEEQLDSCRINRDDPNFECYTREQSTAYCYNDTMDVRLTGGGSNYGYVQITYEGVTGYLYGSDSRTFTAACNSLGFNGGVEYAMPKMFASSWWHASTDNTNYEFPLLAVNTQRPGGTDSVNKYMSVYCYGKVKLRSINAGIVLEYKYTEFYAFCADGFSQKEGDSVCRELGYPRATEITFGNSGVKNVIGFHNFTCPEGANSTDECTLTFTGNGHGCVLGITYVSCEVPVNPTDGSNRLSITALKIIATMFLIPAITSVFDI